jgi:hypothetical protein
LAHHKTFLDLFNSGISIDLQVATSNIVEATHAQHLLVYAKFKEVKRSLMVSVYNELGPNSLEFKLLVAACKKGGGSFLKALPIDPELTMGHQEFKIALQIYLGKKVLLK